MMSDKDLAAEISAEIDHLAAQLVELDLLGEDNRGTPRLPKDERVLRANPWAWSIEVEHSLVGSFAGDRSGRTRAR
jgi:hypothetical protein